MKKTTDPSVKKPYRKPTLQKVELLAEEVLAEGCKSDSGNNFSNPIGCAAPTMCVQTGS